MMDLKANWITYPGVYGNAPLFKKEFSIEDQVNSAILYISGLGCFELRINGKVYENIVLEPSMTDYDEKVLYCKYDVSDYLQNGMNIISVSVGRGFYNMDTENVWGWHKAPWKGKQKLIAQLEMDFEDKKKQCIYSGEDWEVAPSPTIYDCAYVGEIYDTRLESNLEFVSAILATPPRGKLCVQEMEPMKIIERVLPVSYKNLEDGVLFDFGMEYTGFVEINTIVELDQMIEIRYYEKSPSEELVDNHHISAEIQLDKVIGNGGSIVWHSKFSYKAFRYVKITNLPKEAKIAALQVNNDVAKIGHFSCSNETINWIISAMNNTILRNLHGIPTDTPVYEKNGWTGDAQLIAPYAIMTFDMKKFFKKWMGDFSDSQSFLGEIPPIVPSAGWGMEYSDFGWELVKGAVPAWDIAYLSIPLDLYKYYGDKSSLIEHYANMKKYISYLENNTEDDLFKGGLGDWLPPTGIEEVKGSRAVTEGNDIISTMYYCKTAGIAASIAGILGYEQDKFYYTALFERICKKINETYYDRTSKSYNGNNSVYRQAPNILAVAFDIVNKEDRQAVVDGVANDVRSKNNHLDTGILGTRYILEVLTDGGHLDLAYEIITKEDYPSLGFWKKLGHNTLLEAWESNARSTCHYMFGGLAIWFYESVLGIKISEAGYKRIDISPEIPTKLRWAKGSIDTEFGTLGISWEKKNQKIIYSLIIPEGVKATFENCNKLCAGINAFEQNERDYN